MGGHHQRRAMKDGLDRKSVERLARNLTLGLPEFDAESFVDSACAGLETLELKARVAHIADMIAAHTHGDTRSTLSGILSVIPNWDRGAADDSLRGFSTWPVFVYLEKYCTNLGEFGLRALGQLTHLFTAEFAVRPFIEKNTEMSLVVIREWTQHPSDQVRRLASEGLRPRLPWASRLGGFVDDPRPVIAILDMLVDDESLFVRRSVANNLSDIAVDHPDLVIATCQRWLESPSAERRWVAKRATRNLIKSGHSGVWELHGYTAAPSIAIEGLAAEPRVVSMDQKFSVDFTLSSLAKVEQCLVVDFVVHHVRAGGKTSPKVFKLCELRLAPGERVLLRKQHAFRSITTRRYYPGDHRIEIQVNGERHSETWVRLE